jgi:hypothetical protein
MATAGGCDSEAASRDGGLTSVSPRRITKKRLDVVPHIDVDSPGLGNISDYMDATVSWQVGK